MNHDFTVADFASAVSEAASRIEEAEKARRACPPGGVTWPVVQTGDNMAMALIDLASYLWDRGVVDAEPCPIRSIPGLWKRCSAMPEIFGTVRNMLGRWGYDGTPGKVYELKAEFSTRTFWNNWFPIDADAWFPANPDDPGQPRTIIPHPLSIQPWEGPALRLAAEQLARVVEVEKKTPPGPQGLSPDSLWRAIELSKFEGGFHTKYRKIVHAILSGRLTASAIADKTGLLESTVANRIDLLMKAGDVAINDDGLTYRLTRPPTCA